MDENQIKEHIVLWALNLGLSTGHAETIDDLLDEIGEQIVEMRNKITGDI